MSNQLPAHLLALFNANPDIAEVGKNVQNESHAKIRYNGSKWKLIPASGDEIAITTSHLDVIVVDINEHKSHVVFEKAFDPKGEPEAPLWQSDDGTPVPAEHETKVVSDYRRVAVLIAENPEGGVYELRVSAGSITNFDRYNTTIRNFGAPIGSLVTRITFDAAVDYPKLVFTPTGYLSEAQAATLGKTFTDGKRLVQLALGKRKEQQLALPAPAAQATIAAPSLADQINQASAAPVVEPVKATRKRKEASAPVEAPAVVLPMAAAVVTAPKATGSELDNLLANIMGGR